MSVKEKIVPSFHILIASGGRPSLLQLLNSLKYELNETDAITIVFDGENARAKSTITDDWFKDHKSKITVLEEIPNLGYWGHAIRNKYQSNLTPQTTFLMNADDDDLYRPNSFSKLRELCTDENVLYIAKMYVEKFGNKVIPSQAHSIAFGDIGTPCGIIPSKLAGKGTWGYCYGGDYEYYYTLVINTRVKCEFLNEIIYDVL